jgi:polyhydroxyalkanoate synthesis regulator phasin
VFETSAKNAPEEDTSGDEAPRVGQSARDLIERVFLLGVGAAALTKDRAQEVVEDLVRRGHLSRDESRDMVEKVMARSREEARSAIKRADSSLQGAYHDLGLVGKRELEDLDLRLRQLEHRVQLLEATADAESRVDRDSPAF